MLNIISDVFLLLLSLGAVTPANRGLVYLKMKERLVKYKNVDDAALKIMISGSSYMVSMLLLSASMYDLWNHKEDLYILRNLDFRFLATTIASIFIMVPSHSVYAVDVHDNFFSIFGKKMSMRERSIWINIYGAWFIAIGMLILLWGLESFGCSILKN